MTVSRFVSRVSKPFLTSLCRRLAPGLWAPGLWAPGLWAPCRTIITGKDHVKSAPFGRKKKVPEVEQPDVFDAFLGNWVQVSGTLTSPDGVVKPINRPQTYEALIQKPNVSFKRNKDRWRVLIGFEFTDQAVHYNFHMGKEFMMNYPDIGLYKILVFQDGVYMKWSIEPYYYNPFPSRKSDKGTFQVIEVVNDQIIWKTEFPNWFITHKIYIKSEEWYKK